MSKGRNEQVARVVAEIQILSSHPAGLSTPEIHARISEQFEVSLRTVYRDLEAIERAGFPLFRSEEGPLGERGVKWTLRSKIAVEKHQILSQRDLAALRKLKEKMAAGRDYPAEVELLMMSFERFLEPALAA